MSTQMSPIENPIERLRNHIKNNTLVRDTWMGIDADGRETACLLAALSPECGAARDVSACPADLMPAWLAQLTPWIDDSGTLKHWPTVVRRYADLAARWRVLDAETWKRLDFAVRAICVREATEVISEETDGTATEVRKACVCVVALCDRAAVGDYPTEQEWKTAAAAAEAAAAAAAEAAAAEAAAAAAEAAEAAAEAAARAAAEAAARAAAEAEAEAEAADRIIDQVLNVIENAIVAIEARG